MWCFLAFMLTFFVFCLIVFGIFFALAVKFDIIQADSQLQSLVKTIFTRR